MKKSYFIKRPIFYFLFIGIFVMGHSLFFGHCWAEAEPMYLTIATGGTGGTFLPTGGGWAELLTKKCKLVKGASAQITAASVENARLLNEKKVDLAMISWIGPYGAKMTKEQVKNLRSMFYIQTSECHFVVKKDSNIYKIADFKGKRVAVGPPGSATERCSKLIFELFGVTFKDIKPSYVTFREGIEAFKDGRVDVTHIAAGAPISSVMDAATVRDIRLISLGEKDAKLIEKNYPFLPRIVISAGNYRGQDKDVITVGTAAAMMVHYTIPEDVVFEMMKVTYANKKWMAENIHKIIHKWRFLPSVGNITPLHTGAVKFYKEMKMMK